MASGIAVVEIEVAYHRAIDERRGLGGNLLTETENAAGVFPGSLAMSKPSTNLRRLTVVRADGAAKGIDQPLHRRVDALGGQIFVARGGRILGDLPCDVIQWDTS
jgi:hypothetical protein